MQVQATKAPVFLLGLGNRKLGETVYTFTLPAVDTCPGRSKLCEKVCYALKGHLGMARTQGHFDKRHVASLKDDFADRITKEIRFRDCKLVRLHVAGDFYSAEYVRKWIEIVEACSTTRFFVYTRSWRVPKIRKALNLLARLPNIRVWHSCDRDTGIPPKIGRNIRIAYMADGDNDEPPRTPDLGFRVIRKTIVKRIGGAVVCPVENGSHPNVNCQKCGLCWEPLETKDARRFALTMA